MTDTERPSTSDKKYSDFQRHLWYNPAVCNNCFSRIRDRYTIWKEQYPVRLRPALADEYTLQAEDGETGYDVVDVADGISISFPRTTCGNCGSVGGKSQAETKSTSELLDCVDNISDRLDEQGLDVDESVMYDVVRKGKERETLQGYDREILAAAVRVGSSVN